MFSISKFVGAFFIFKILHWGLASRKTSHVVVARPEPEATPRPRSVTISWCHVMPRLLLKFIVFIGICPWKSWKDDSRSLRWFGSVSKPSTPVVHIKIAGKWMFIPLKMVLIGIDPYPFRTNSLKSSEAETPWQSSAPSILTGQGAMDHQHFAHFAIVERMARCLIHTY